MANLNLFADFCFNLNSKMFIKMEDSKENQLKNTVSFSKDFLISSDNNDEDPHASMQNSPKQITFNKLFGKREFNQ
ncbi:hypothetical protein BLOT_004899 [Blomia tropicalis]|nr:hypothetical protein BLOT_004899 [Blomia tropicalis]